MIARSLALLNAPRKTITSAYTAVDYDKLDIDTTGGAVTVTLPLNPLEGAKVFFLDSVGNFATNNLTVARNGQTIMGFAEDMIASTNNVDFSLEYINGDWRLM